jgi:hypothetical protein
VISTAERAVKKLDKFKEYYEGLSKQTDDPRIDNGYLSQFRQGLRDELTELIKRYINEENPEGKIAQERSRYMLEAAKKSGETGETGVWKIGDKHVEDLVRSKRTLGSKPEKTTLTTRDEFNKEYDKFNKEYDA